jgi:hypothetical protein
MNARFRADFATDSVEGSRPKRNAARLRPPLSPLFSLRRWPDMALPPFISQAKPSEHWTERLFTSHLTVATTYGLHFFKPNDNGRFAQISNGGRQRRLAGGCPQSDPVRQFIEESVPLP